MPKSAAALIVLPGFLAGLAFAGAGMAADQPPSGEPLPEIRFEKFVLSNGLTLIVHEDHKVPIVAVNVWYHVGSKNEKRGKTGFAHLFEHLMFNGSENFNDDYFKALEKVGATDMNGTTNSDRTNYFQNVPTTALDLALFMESDRMGHLLGAIDKARLDEQRGVVQNEKRQGENQPYGVTRQLLSENTYPPGHPYSWTTIGSMEDLDAATLDDVRTWFKTYYGPNNAVLVVAGDVEAEAVRTKVERAFGDIPPGPPIARQASWVAKMTGTHRQAVQDRVPQARVYQVWNAPEWGTPEAVHLDLAAAILGGGKSSRLYRRLVYENQSATDVSVGLSEYEIGSQFQITATAKPGGGLSPVEAAIGEEISRFIHDGPTAAELARVREVSRASFLRGMERIGGFGGKSDILASNMVHTGDPGFYRKRLAMEAAATVEDLQRAAREWLSDGVYVLEVLPFPKLAAGPGAIDRKALPVTLPPPLPRFPAFQSEKLANGLTLIVCRREAAPVLQLNLLVDAGYAADAGRAPGTASLTMGMLDEGTATRTALEISEALDRLGARLSTGAGLDTCQVSLSALRETIDPALDLFADVVLNPTFPPADFERQKKHQLARIAREKVTPPLMAMRVGPPLLYGAGHPYAQPFTGSGLEESVGRLTREDLVEFHRAWFGPNNATLIVVGDATLADIRPRVEKLFASWKPVEAAKKPVPLGPDASSSVVYLVDRPGSQQSVIFAGQLAPPRANPDEAAIAALQDVLGGSFTSRINMNLREDKHWSYGARTSLPDARGQRPYFVMAPVQADKTVESMREIEKELKAVVGEHPLTEQELAKAKDQLTLSLPGRWETSRAVASSIAEIVEFGLPPDYFNAYPAALRALTLDEVNAVARRLIHPERLVWLVVGDRAAIESGVRSLGFGEVRLIDADGKLVREGADR